MTPLPRDLTCSVIILSYRTPELTIRSAHAAWQAINRTIPPAEGELIVVDNASGDDTLDRVSRELPGAVLFQNNRNMGYGAGNNIGFNLSRGRIIVFVNSDAFLSPETLTAMLKIFTAMPSAGAVGPALKKQDGSPQWSWGIPPTAIRLITEYLLPRTIHEKWKSSHIRWIRSVAGMPAAAVPYISGACFAIRAEAFASAGGFREHRLLYGEEVELCSRLLKAGWEVLHLPGESIVHIGSGSATCSPVDCLECVIRAQTEIAHDSQPWLPKSLTRGLLGIGFLGKSALVRMIKSEGTWSSNEYLRLGLRLLFGSTVRSGSNTVSVERGIDPLPDRNT